MLRRRYLWGLTVLAALAATAFCLTLLTGSAGLGPGRALGALLGHGDEFSRLIVWTVRLPRATAAFAVGALLALAGVLLQALFRNPLADPLVLGVSGGAAVGALAGMLIGAGSGPLHLYATAGGAGVGLIVLLLGRGGGATRLLLCGVVLASACGALITVMLTLADNGQLRGMVFWLAGDLSWAQHPGIELLAAGIALVTAALGGGTLLCCADLLSRTVAAPRELPVGAVMALIGAPVFVLLLRRQTR